MNLLRKGYASVIILYRLTKVIAGRRSFLTVKVVFSSNRYPFLKAGVVFSLLTAAFFSANAAEQASTHLEVTVLKADSGQPLSGVFVGVLESPQSRWITRENGTISSNDLQSVEYTLRLFKAGFEPMDVDGIDLAHGSSKKLTVHLHPRDSKNIPTELDQSNVESETHPASDIAMVEVSAEVIRSSEFVLSLIR